MKTLQRGFTLIELLVVISVIGILASVMVANFSNVRAKSRDGVRKKDMEQIRLALETYRIDVGQYPVTLYSSSGNCTGTDALQSTTTPPTVYMEDIPCDPKTSTEKYVYNRVTTLTYTLTKCLENENDSGLNVATVPVGTGTNQCPSGKRLELKNP